MRLKLKRGEKSKKKGMERDLDFTFNSVTFFVVIAYGYVVRAKTTVNGKELAVATPLVSVNVGDVAATSGMFFEYLVLVRL